MKHDFVKYLNPVFIETGSYMGEGIQGAINSGFKEIHSIELMYKFWQHCRKRFRRYDYVNIWLGHSEQWLPIILREINKRCTFWLDAHYSGGDTGETYPILKELEIIKDHHIKEHTILIDDMRLFRKGYGGISAEDIKESLKGYDISYEYGVAENDILIAT